MTAAINYETINAAQNAGDELTETQKNYLRSKYYTFEAAHAKAKPIPAEVIAASFNGTGYFDQLVKIDLAQYGEGDLFSGIDPHNRKIVVIKTDLGNVVLFQRYTPGCGPDVLVGNYPRALGFVLARLPYMSSDEFHQCVLSGWDYFQHIGKYVKMIVRDVRKIGQEDPEEQVA